MHIKLVPHS